MGISKRHRVMVHQIWIGGEMPAAESAWVASVKAVAESAGWQHKLWSWPDLLAAYGHEPVAALFRRLLADFPMPTTYTLMADYYRLRVLADAGGVYLDADFSATSWPDWPDDADVYLLGEYFSRTSPCNGFYYCRRPDVMRRTAMMAARHLLEILPPDAPDLPKLYVNMVRRDGHRGGLPNCGIGPGYIRRRILPVWHRNGVRMKFIPENMVGHRQWKNAAALVHHGTAHWHEGGKAQNDPFWQRVAEEADARTKRNMETAKQCARNGLPAHLRPCGGVVVPAVLASARTRQADGARSADVPPQFRLRSDVRRVVVLST